jgi:hypothetical protein
MNQKQQTEIDWCIARSPEGQWEVRRDGKPDTGEDAPAGLKGIFSELCRLGTGRDLPDIGVAYTGGGKRTNDHCPLTSARISNDGTISTRAAPRSRRGEWEAVAFAFGRRWFLHPDGLEAVAPTLGKVMRSFYSETPVAEPEETHREWRNRIACWLLVTAFGKNGDVNPLRSAWLTQHAIALLTQPAAAESKPVEQVNGPARAASRRQAVRG